MKAKILIGVSIVSLLALLAFSQVKAKPFAPAEDFPRDALIYVQIADLPAIIKLWNESKFKENYTESDNFLSFQNQHLGRKLASRWGEFNTATGFPIDLETAARLADKRAAMAIYDIGKLEFVFVAPVSDELFAAMKFVQNRDKFTAETLADGTVIYRTTVAADRGRQQQELIYTNVKGRFVLATGEKLLAQTLNNINGVKGVNRLADEPTMAVLSEKIEPHLATVWVNQTALNDDYYFNRYWLMSEVKDLKNIRAGIFDFEMQEGKFIERRKFLLNKNVETSPITNRQAEKLLSLLPENIPFYQMKKADPKTVDETIGRTIFDRQETAEQPSKNHFYFSVYDDYSSNDYESLGEKYDQTIDDAEEKTTVESKADFGFSNILAPAEPQAALTFTEPKFLPAPLFVEFRRAAIYHLDAPDAFDRTAFEAAIARKISEDILISSPGVKLIWKTESENDSVRRELKLPMLGWTIGYALRGAELILTNNSDFLSAILASEKTRSVEIFNESFDELPMVNLTRKEDAFDRIFDELAGENTANDFFSGNVSSLLDSLSDVRRIEIRKTFSQNFLEEELIFAVQ